MGDYLQLEYEREGVQCTAERIQSMVGSSRIENEQVGEIPKSMRQFLKHSWRNLPMGIHWEVRERVHRKVGKPSAK